MHNLQCSKIATFG